MSKWVDVQFRLRDIEGSGILQLVMQAYQYEVGFRWAQAHEIRCYPRGNLDNTMKITYGVREI